MLLSYVTNELNIAYWQYTQEEHLQVTDAAVAGLEIANAQTKKQMDSW